MSGDGQIVYASADPHRWSQEKCAGNVHWLGGKLQQLFEITEFIGNSPIGTHQVWRDVPKEIAP